MDAKQEIFRIMVRIMLVLKAGAQKELEDQGHVLTGKLRDSIQVQAREVENEVIRGIMTGEPYGLALNDGVPGENIPYTRGSGAKSSKYIDGLIRFFKLRGKSDIEAKRAAFATANVHKKEGMPSRGSFRYSKNGRRKGFIDHAVADNYEDIDKMIETELGDWIEGIVLDIVKAVK